MATALTLDPADDNIAITVPEDGDDLDAADVEAVFQRLADRAHLARNALLTHIVWSGDLVVESGGSLTSFSVKVGPISKMVVADEDGEVRVASPTSEATLGVADIEGTPGTLGDVTRFWYVYAFHTTTISSGAAVVDYAISLTPPDVSRRYKGGDPTRVYLGCFPVAAVSGTRQPIPLRACDRRYRYRVSALAATALRTTPSGGSATSYTDLDLSALVPPHARLAHLHAYLEPGGGASSVGGANLRRNGDTTGALTLSNVGTTAGLGVDTYVDIETDASRLIEYRVTGGGSGDPVATFDVLGWVE